MCEAFAATNPVSVASRTLRVAADGRLQLRISCRAANGQLCRGRLTLSWLVSRKRQTLGRADFTVAGHTTGVVTIVLSSTQRRTLSHARRLRGTTTIVARAGRSPTVRTTTAVVIRAKAD